ncbi:MAG: hypothetical protein HY921_03325 [Elusimicrobia bacterium]|nr:hypothetical protein [Elusimicrobiota bacterium]
MTAPLEFIKDHWMVAATGVLGWGVGFFTDIGKEHFRRKMRLREEHAHEIQKEVLAPIYAYLKEFYLPVCQMKMSPIEVGTEVINRNKEHIAQDTYVRTEFRVRIKTPAKTDRMGIFQDDYWHETEGFQRYFDDALKVHYPDLLQRWKRFEERYRSMAGKARENAESVIPKLQELAGLQLAYAGGAPEPGAWANYPHIAVLVLNRRLGIGEEGLCVPGGSNNEVKTSRTQTQVVKCGSSEQGAQIIAAIDKIAKDSTGIEKLKAEFGILAEEAKRLHEDFRFALAKKPALERCPFV